jgi:hypothetical protein
MAPIGVVRTQHVDHINVCRASACSLGNSVFYRKNPPILAMAMVICLFGGYVDSPNERRISTASPDHWFAVIGLLLGLFGAFLFLR